MLLCKLCGALLAVTVKLPEGVRVKSVAAAETLVAGGAFVALLPSRVPFFLTCFEPQKRHFLCSKAFNSRKPYSVRVAAFFSTRFVHYAKISFVFTVGKVCQICSNSKQHTFQATTYT
ncbi:hypothetical protein [Cardiobacterium valvarum]|uniref:hypothetical protein n=1 Tax=Cardiobacterium valvarum TaxID=194702 RepID=UPI0011C07541|nr:hypothetical protein [Cardiobacterium valvarum]